MAIKKRLGELLVETGLITGEQLARALAEQTAKKGRLGEIIVDLGMAREEEIAQALSVQLGIAILDLMETPVEPQAIDLIPEKVARKHLILPVAIDQKDLQVAMADPLSFDAVEDVRFASGYSIRPALATRSQILWAIDHHYHLGSSIGSIVRDITEERFVEVVPEAREGETRDTEDLRKKSEAAPVIRMVNLIVAEAVTQGASDIHVEPMKSTLQIRHRIDGLLRKSLDLPKWVQGAVVSRIKIMARMDISEKRLPQDGRITVRVGGKTIDLRVSTIPASYGEKVVIRVLDAASALIPMEGLGMSEEEHALIEGLIRHPHGILLVTGPTGSGKTTTLYAALNRIRSVDRNIMTIEDPIEYELPGINQIAVQDKIGLTFASTFRAILRQDPDVVMLGEMRDLETATIAMQAALTGHLVLSTLHTNSAAASITRLRNLGIPSYLIASTVVGIVAQRLVRLVCSKCRVESLPTEKDVERLGLLRAGGEASFSRGAGCPACGGTGYRGRCGVFEILPFTPPIRQMVASDAAESEIRQASAARGMRTLGRATLDKVKAGLTTVSELYNVVDSGEAFGDTCPYCGAVAGPGFVACAECGQALVSTCPSCGRSVSPGWKFCPYCRYAGLGTTDARLED